MASVRFYLRDKASSTSAIMARMYYDSNEFPIATGQSIIPKYWNHHAQKVEKTKNASEINIILNSFKVTLLNAYYELEKAGFDNITNKMLRAKLDGKNPEKLTSLYEHIEEIIERRRILKISTETALIVHCQNTMLRITG